MRKTARNYPPLITVGFALFLVLAVLPSSLNVPNTNPTQTLEYAPVPPGESSQSSATGNLSSLTLASSSSITDAATPPQVDVPARGRSPSTKRCIGNPPKQTEDPLSPPCVAYFEGDNFGATYPGVQGDEVRILFYFDGGFWNDLVTSRGNEERPDDVYYDLAKAPSDDEHVFVRMLRLLQRYFNARYQTYGRFVHFFVYYTAGDEVTPQLRRADAAAHYARVRPFAVVPDPTMAEVDAYLEAMAQKGVLTFSSLGGREAKFFRRFEKLIWSYLPSIEQEAKVYSDFVCSKVVPFKVSSGGNAANIGKPRRLGLLRTTDSGFPGMHRFASEAKRRVEACGGNFVADRTFPYAGVTIDARTTGDYAVTNIADFVQRGVTTVIWAQGFEVQHSRQAARAGFRPEWVIAGDGYHEGFQTGQQQDQSVWDRHAFVVTPLARRDALRKTRCYAAHKEADANAPQQDVSYVCGFYTFYEDLRLLFTGVQVAGARLTPGTIDKGLHVIPAVESDDPQVPACFFEPGDYTCVKDAQWDWWDQGGKAAGSNQNGCWRMNLDGRRFIAGGWPEGDMARQRTGRDACNNYVGGLILRIPDATS